MTKGVRASHLPVDEFVTDSCAVCGEAATVYQAGPALFQVNCVSRKHRTRFYSDRRSSVMAWNVNQRHKINQGKPHG